MAVKVLLDDDLTREKKFLGSGGTPLRSGGGFASAPSAAMPSPLHRWCFRSGRFFNGQKNGSRLSRIFSVGNDKRSTGRKKAVYQPVDEDIFNWLMNTLEQKF